MALVADPEPDILLVLEGEASQVAEAAGKYVLGKVSEPSGARFWNPRRDGGEGATAVFRINRH